VRAAEPKVVASFRATSATISGSGMDWHDVDAYFKPAFAAYGFDAKNNVVFNKLDRKFDVAIVQDCSQCPVNPTLKPVFPRVHDEERETLRKHRATPVFFMTWAYEDVPGMTATSPPEYTTAGNANDALRHPPRGSPSPRRSTSARTSRSTSRTSATRRSRAAISRHARVFASLLRPHARRQQIHTAGLDPSLAAFLQIGAWKRWWSITAHCPAKAGGACARSCSSSASSPTATSSGCRRPASACTAIRHAPGAARLARGALYIVLDGQLV
jgi:hypothetical protein